MRSNLLRAHFGLVAACALALPSCLLPELDTPAVDPALLELQKGEGSAASTPCHEGIKAPSLKFLPPSADPKMFGYEGQCVVGGSVTLDLSAPASMKLAEIRVIEGGLTIRAGADVAVGQVLPNLEEVMGPIVITGTALKAIPTFGKLKKAQLITISDNHALKAIAGFGALESTPGIEIDNNPLLASVAGFGKLSKVTSHIRVRGNFALASMTAFAGLEGTTAGLHFDKGVFPKLSFPKLTQLNSLVVVDNAMTQLSLPLVENVSELRLRQLDELKTIALPKLQSIVSLEISSVQHLTDAKWLPAKAHLSSTATICPVASPLVDALKAWAQANGSTGTVQGTACQ